ncbi:MAG: phosphoribosyltransferase family protein [Chitinophagaceae bacterium]
MDTYKNLLSQAAIEQKIKRMALEVAEQLHGEKNTSLVIIGIAGSGTVIAQQVFGLLQTRLQMPVQYVTLSMNKHQPSEVSLSETIDFTDKLVLIVDDVANSGSTLLFALKPLLTFLPRQIQTMVLVERMYKKYPVQPNYVGLSVATTSDDYIQVLVENGVIMGANLIQRGLEG